MVIFFKFGCPVAIFVSMFIRQKKNKSGSVSVQIISKAGGKYKVIKTLGSAFTAQEIEILLYQAQAELAQLEGRQSLFVLDNDALIESFLQHIENAQIRTVGPELIFGEIYDGIGFNLIEEELFRHLVLSRLYFPLSKLKTLEYLHRYQGIRMDINRIYRFLDKLASNLKGQVEQISFAHTCQVLQGMPSIVFYDLTTLYFEASDEDDLRKTGFSKDGKHQNPQIYLGLLVGLEGYAIAYDIFEGDIYEGHTLIPFLEKIQGKFKLTKPIVVADAGLLSQKNIEHLESQAYPYILGARIKAESESMKHQILNNIPQEGSFWIIQKEANRKLIIEYSPKRAKKDYYNRQRGLRRLEKQLKKGKLSKKHINNRGYNKYLKMKGEIAIEIDYDKFQQDARWDGLKGYISNSSLNAQQVMENYKQLWHIEKAFRMSKTDLRIRPIYHRLKSRIEAHICIAFTAYTIYKELERILKLEKCPISVKKATEITQNMYQMTITLPQSKHPKNILLKMDQEQAQIKKIVDKYY